MPGDSSDRRRRIFISYRRRVAGHSVDLIWDRLAKRLGDGLVFYDQHEIVPGEPFPQRLRDALNDCEVVLAVIDPDWVDERYLIGDRQGERRLDDPTDWVRIEIETALAGKYVVPLLAMNTSLLKAEQLPPSLAPLAKLQAQQLRSGPDGQHDFERLAQLLADQLGITLRSALPPVFSVLPRRNPYFTGREKELGELAERLAKDGIAVLGGLGGMGKTDTALEYADRHAAEYQVVFWTTADTESNLFTGLVRLAQQLNLPQKDAQDQNLAVQAARRWLAANDGWLLILDNADTNESIGAIAKVLPSKNGTAHRDPLARTGHVLVTSRRANVAVLGVAQPIELEPLRNLEAQEFLRSRTGRTDVHGHELDALVQLAVDLGYLPLALEQAAAYIKDREGLTFAAYRTRFQQGTARARLDLIEKKLPEMGQRDQRSLAVTWLLNFEEVEKESPASADLLRFFAFLAPESVLITCGAAELGKDVAAALQGQENDSLALADLLEPLGRYSLTKIDRNTQTLRIHRLVQLALQAKLEEGRDRIAWIERTVAALNAAFPDVEFVNWRACARLLPHVIALMPEIRGIASSSATVAQGALLLARAGTYQSKQGYFEDAEASLMQAREVAAQGTSAKSSAVAVALSALGSLYHERGRRGDHKRAEEAFLEAISIRRGLAEDDPLKLAETLYGLAKLRTQLATRREQFEEAESLFQEALQARKQRLGAGHPAVADVLYSLGKLYSRWHWDYGRAEEHYRQALAIYRNARNPNDPSIAAALVALAHVCKATKRYSEAEDFYRQGLAIVEVACRPDHPSVAECRGHLADVLRLVGNFHDAREVYLQALPALQQELGPEHLSVASVLSDVGKLHHHLGDFSQAEQCLKEALRIREAGYGPDHATVAESLCELARLYSEMGWSKHLDALRLAARAVVLVSRGDNVSQQQWHRSMRFEVWFRLLATLFAAVTLPSGLICLGIALVMWILTRT